MVSYDVISSQEPREVEVPADVYMTVRLITRDREVCAEITRIYCYFKETVSWDGFVLWELQGSTSRGMTLTGSLSQAHSKVNVLGGGALFSDSR